MKVRVVMCAAVMALFAFFANPAFAQLSGIDYGVDGVRSAQGVQQGVVVDVVASVVSSEASPAARIAGGALGGAACTAVTSHWSSWVARAAVATACAAGGERVANTVATSRDAARTFIVRIDGGGTVAVTQVDPGIYRGQRVYVLTGQGTRIVPAGAV